MSEVVGEGVVRLRTDESGVDVAGAGKRAGDGYAKGFGGSIKGLAGVIGGVLAAGAVLDFTKDAVAAARESAKIAATTEQVIKATGGAAGITADQVGQLAESIANATGVDDELIQSGQNLLLTFKQVRNEAGKNNDVFDRATKAAVDLSAAGFGSVESASLQLGKALNDPLKGISALARSGVTFTEQQKEQIKTLVESGDVMSAQKIILGEVEAQVGGVAEASASSADRLKVVAGNLQEAFGGLLLPLLDRVNEFLISTVAPAIFQLIDAAGGLGPVFAQVGDVIGSVFSGGGGAGGALSEFVAVVQTFAATTGPLLRDLFINDILPAVTSLAEYLIANVVPIFQHLGQIIVSEVVPTLLAIATIIYGTVYPAIVQIVTTVATQLKPVFDQLIASFRESVLPTLQQLVATIRDELLPALQPIIERVLQVVGILYRLAATVLSVVLPPLIRFQAFLFANVVPAIAAIVIAVVKIIGMLIEWGAAIGNTVGKLGGFARALVSVVRDGIDLVIAAVTFLPRKILDLGPKLLEAGKGIMGAFLTGLKTAGGFVSGIADAVWEAVKGVINSAIDRLNGLLEFKISIPGAPDINVNAPNIGHLQAGTRDWRGGVARVGEVGPETLYLPPGARVDTAARTAQTQASDMEGLADAVAAALAPFLTRPNLTLAVPTGDPEAVALMVANRLAVD